MGPIAANVAAEVSVEDRTEVVVVRSEETESDLLEALFAFAVRGIYVARSFGVYDLR